VNLRSKKSLALVATLLLLFAGAVAKVPYLSTICELLFAGVVLVLLFLLAWRLFQRFLYKVGRRLAFSYFLIGVLPIPMVLLLLLVGCYLLAGFFMGHLFRDVTRGLQGEVQAQAEAGLAEFARTGKPLRLATARDLGTDPDIVLGYYRNGRRVMGDPRTPAAWPDFPTAEASASGEAGDGRREVLAPFLSLADGSPTLAGLAQRTAADAGAVGVVALYVGHLEAMLSERSGVWVEMIRPDEADAGSSLLRVQVGSRTLPLQRIHRERAVGAAARFFRKRSQGQRVWDAPLLWWGEVAGEQRRVSSGKPVSLQMSVSLRSSPRILLRHLFSSSAEVDTAAWGALFALAFLLFDVYIVALGMAIVMIFGLSRAVNRMSRATAALQSGDFTVRIPAKRRDQLGELQRSFNQMAGNLESLVATAAQKEALEKELQLARELQKSLIPGNLPSGGAVEFASLFEPSAAIGGDYFDILRLDDRRLAVIIADVSGHGLSTGLRMAMIKAALTILVQEENDPEKILSRLDAVVRADTRTRFFVTATLALIDFREGTLVLTNAGHPPTYLLRKGEVEEILLPGSPLGGMGKSYGRRTVPLLSGDTLVWLSDGLIEATNAADDVFGYDAVVAALAGPAASPTVVRDRLLAAIERHVQGEPPQDDRTLLVMRYSGP
jgi:serine phosphatase RsbU (regulator of sigma subunit)